MKSLHIFSVKNKNKMLLSTYRVAVHNLQGQASAFNALISCHSPFQAKKSSLLCLEIS